MKCGPSCVTRPLGRWNPGRGAGTEPGIDAVVGLALGPIREKSCRFRRVAGAATTIRGDFRSIRNRTPGSGIESPSGRPCGLRPACRPARGASREYSAHARLIQPTIRLRSFPPGAPRCSSLAEHLFCRFSRSRAGTETDCAARTVPPCGVPDRCWRSGLVSPAPGARLASGRKIRPGGGAGRCLVSAGRSGGRSAGGRGGVEANGPGDDEVASLVANL